MDIVTSNRINYVYAQTKAVARKVCEMDSSVDGITDNITNINIELTNLQDQIEDLNGTSTPPNNTVGY